MSIKRINIGDFGRYPDNFKTEIVIHGPDEIAIYQPEEVGGEEYSVSLNNEQIAQIIKHALKRTFS